MNWIRIRLPFVLVILGVASYVVFLEAEASSAAEDQITASAVWDPPPSDLARISQTCQAEQGEAYSRCFLGQMPDFGATPEAVAFTQGYAAQNQGTIAFLKDFRAMDAVDLGYAYLPSVADSHKRWLLLNGSPGVIDVDDLKLLPLAEMTSDPAYTAILRRHPKLTLVSGERMPDAIPATETLPDDGQRLVIDYPLKEQCRTCPLLGQASFSFEFNDDGKLVGVKFVKVSPLAAATK